MFLDDLVALKAGLPKAIDRAMGDALIWNYEEKGGKGTDEELYEYAAKRLDGCFTTAEVEWMWEWSARIEDVASEINKWANQKLNEDGTD